MKNQITVFSKKTLVTTCFLINCSVIYGLKIDRVILSTNNNPMYIEFWPSISKAWTKLIGIRPTLALIADKSVEIDETLGDVIRFEPIEGIPTSFQAQVIRLLLPAYFEDEVSILSDIDMLPINKEYFTNSASHVPDDCFVVYRDGFYSRHGYNTVYPICYVAAKGKTFKEVFKIKDIKDIPQIIKEWYANAEPHPVAFGWICDERMLFEYLTHWKEKEMRLVKLGQDIEHTRLSRLCWGYDKDLLRKNFYNDAHLLRPYSIYKNECDELMRDLGLT